MNNPRESVELLPCPFCGAQPTKGLTKKRGCQMHGDPMQYAIIGCTKCEFSPSCQGGCIYRGGDKPKYKDEAYAEAAKKWNTRPSFAKWLPIDTAPKDGSRVMLWNEKWSDISSGQFYGNYWACMQGARWKYQPSHWKPLDAPPRISTPTKGGEDV